MEISRLRDFLTLAECGNFSRAAELRHLTQPAFSRRIRLIEEWLGVTLFDRSAHPVTLTRAGQRFQPLAEDILRRLVQAREETRAAEKMATSTLRFAATHALSLTFFPDWLRGLESRLHIGPVQLISDTLMSCEEAMRQGRSQFLLCHHHAKLENGLDPADFSSISVGEDTLLPVSCANGTGRPRFTLPAGSDAGAPVLFYSPESGLGRIVRMMLEATTKMAQQEPVFTSHLAVVLKAMALDGRGIAWLPRSLIRDELAAGRLLEAGRPDLHIDVEIRLFRHTLPDSAAAESFWRTVEGASRPRTASASP